MAQFNIQVNSNVSNSNKPYILSETYISNECIETFDLFVPVPSGQSRYVIIDYTNAGSDIAETINADKTYTITLDFDTIGTIIQTSSVNIQVSLTNGSQVFYNKILTREHTGNVC